MKSYLIEKAIIEIDSSTAFSVMDNDTSKINWIKGKVSEKDIIAKINEIETRDAHIQPRQNSYPSIQEQLDMMWHDKQNDTTTWEDAIAKVKSDNPKVSE